MRPFRCIAVFALLLAGHRVDATSLSPGNIQSGLVVADGKVLVCQPDNSFTILDGETGRPLVRDVAARCEGFLRLTEHGPLLRTHWGRFRMIDVARSVAEGRLVPRWEIGSAKRGCRSSRIIDGYVICARGEDLVVQSRSLKDASVRWSFTAPGEVMDIVAKDGRLMLQSGDYRLARGISIVDLVRGRPLFQEAVVQDASFSVRSFDGTQVVLEAQPTAGSACTGRILRTLTPDGGRLRAQDSCGDPAPRWQEPQQQDLSKGWTGQDVTLRFALGNRGTWIEGESGGASWLAYQRRGLGHRSAVYEGAGVVVMEHQTRAAASLECLDSRTGRSRWIYVYNPFRTPSREWDQMAARAPRGTVPVDKPLRTEAERVRHEDARDQAPYEGLVFLDPVPARLRLAKPGL